MPFAEAVRIAIDSLRANKLRSFLTVLGIVIGVSSVIAVVAITEGLDRYIAKQVLGLGGKSFNVLKMPAVITSRTQWIEMQRRKDLTMADVDGVRRLCTACQDVGAQVSLGASARYGHTTQNGVAITGITENIPRIGSVRDMQAGRALISTDVDEARAVAVVGTDLVEAFFGFVDPIGKEILLSGHAFKVVGVAEKKGSVFGNSQDNFVWIPITTFRKYFGARRSITITAEAASMDAYEAAQDQARLAMRIRRHLGYAKPDDFEVETGQDIMDLWQNATRGIYVVTIVVTAIALLVGGVVVMNIMLVSVTERVREIGVRKALGAKRRDILRQFLVEAVILALGGGVLGVVGATLFSMALAGVLGGIMSADFSAPVRPWAVGLALSVSTAVGLVAGIYPARRAAALDPVVALRNEWSLAASLGRWLTRRWPILFAVSEAVGMGLAAIRAYKLRAGLTILGVVMGVMTVTGMSAIVAGLNRSMAQQVESLGSSVVFIRPWRPGENPSAEQMRKRKGLTIAEIDAIARKPAVRAVAAIEIVQADLIKSGNAKVQDAQVAGVSAAYADVHDIFMEKGRFFSETDVSRAAPVTVIGASIADALFPFVDPLDKEISIDGRRFHVIGVVMRMGKFLFFDRDNIVLVPPGAIQKKDPRFNFLFADLKPVSPARLDDAIEEARDAIRRTRRLKYLDEDTFAIFSQDTFTQLYQSLTGGIYLVMIAISSIGLVVGGVGVMNIMLVSVTERTREIGIRKALGAKRRDILWQFLTEAMTLTAVGGVLGIVIGAGLAMLINAFSPFPAVVQAPWVVIAFVVSLGVGLTFGLWPAWKAASLDPVEALRYE